MILYGKHFPKIRIVSEDINAFMVESVHATIDVKSLLGEKELRGAYATAHRILTMKNDHNSQRNWRTWCYLVAYKCDAKMQTIANWLRKAAESDGSQSTPNALAAVFVLGKGFVASPSVAYFMKDYKPGLQEGVANSGDWVYVEQESGNLYALFFALNFLRYGIDIRHYFDGVLPAYKVLSRNAAATTLTGDVQS